jgi:hypothetical protein
VLADEALGLTWHPPDVVGVALLTLFVTVLLAVHIPKRLWQIAPDSDYARRLRGIWGATPMGRAIIRTSFLGVVATIAMTLSLILAMLSDTLHLQVLVGPTLALAFIFATVGLLHIPIWLWNRPKFLVPPGLRSQPGVLAERRARKEIKRRHAEGVDGAGPFFTDEPS